MPGTATDYSTYLKIDELLGLQRPLTDGAHDEMLFIVVHQVYELWFRLMIWELDAVVTALSAGEPERALPLMERVVVVDQLLSAQLRLIETMSPEAFIEFRDPLAPASGFQSTQFREIESLGGNGDPRHLTAAHLTEQQREDLRARSARVGLWGALTSALRHDGYAMPDGDDDVSRATRSATLVALYRDHSTPRATVFHRLCERYMDHDAEVARWRFAHALMAAREIGMRTGTGGSAGVAYLESTVAQRFFPELWAVRTQL